MRVLCLMKWSVSQRINEVSKMSLHLMKWSGSPMIMAVSTILLSSPGQNTRKTFVNKVLTKYIY